MRPPEIGSHPSNEMGFPRKNAARRARGISFEGNPFSIIRTYKIWGSSYKGSPPKIVSLRAAQGFFRCAVRQHGASTKIPRSPFPREAEPHFPHGGSDAFCGCEARQRELPSKRSQGGTYNSDQKRMGQPRKNARSAPHFFRWLSLIIQFEHTKIGGFHIGSSPDFCSSLRIMYASLRFFLNFS